MSDVITVKMPARPENILAVRLLVAGLASLSHFNTEEIEDLKLCVCEACSCTPGGNHPLHLSFILAEDQMSVEVRSERQVLKAPLGLEDPTEEGIGFLLMRHLMDGMEFKSNAEGTFIRLIKFHKSSVPVGSGKDV